MSDQTTLEVLRTHALPLRTDDDLDAVVDHIGDAPLVLMGEASHGTSEFYQLRAALSKRLIVERGFDAIVAEADWPDALQVSRFVQLSGGDQTADQAMAGFERFPQWMWRNVDIVRLLYWMRLHNEHVHAPNRRIGFYGMDLYSLQKSMHEVVRYLDRVDPEAANRARERYSCIDHMAADPQFYGQAAALGLRTDCEREVVHQLADMNSQAARHLSTSGGVVPDELFYAQQNARVAQNAERYYRTMFGGRDESWNIRDTHMADTLEALRMHLSVRKGGPARLVVWAHNSHLGDARATEMGRRGQLNLGQLMRQRCGADAVYLLGFSTHDGTVTAASRWDGAAELKRVRPSLPGSVEALLHQLSAVEPQRLARFMLPLRERPEVVAALPKSLLERAIGVIYRPETERLSHYFEADVARQFDAVIHVDHSSAVRPLESSPHWVLDEFPETYPSGL
ncbi:erythromycin esterase family protein [Pseudoduganella sp. FT25W]|uniref:Erythromycin esterase family protein n=1 Tax=Duganella alba TaxID=2666081 RepID=A0A6L5QLB2_9BURK|nr:erythromycin esterase family protein [Duganella alba]MRX10238.1 erythromycin esterase family protein [Duganella alba]MRX18525.1 erythromycin esterase family protein [Duganella alba]